MSEAVELDNLDKIALEAMGGEAEEQAAQDAILNPDPAPVVDPAHTWAQIPMLLGGMLAMIMPELKAVYTEPACIAWGQGMAAVANKYGWDAGETVARFGPEVMLVVASVPLIVPTIAAVKQRQALAAKLQKKEPKESVQAAREPESLNPMDAEPGGFSVPV